MKYNKLAIFAAAGEMPLLAARKAMNDKKDFIIIGFKHLSEFQKLEKFKGVPVYKIHIGYLKSILKILQKEKVDSILMVGKIQKVKFFKVIRFDLTTLGIFLRLKDHSDSSFLQAVVDYFKKNNINFVSQRDFFSDCIMKKGFITKMKCRKHDINNLTWGFLKAKAIAELHIGQSVITGNKVVISAEGVEGTDEMIRRSRPYLLKKNYFIKAARKGHNPVFDLPVFGLETLKLLNQSGIKIIGLEKDIVLIPECERVIELAQKNKMVIYGI